MFEYAFGRHLALKNNSELKVDLSFYENQTDREYMLDHFSLSVGIAFPNEIDLLKQRHFSKLNILKRKLYNSPPYFIHEKTLEFRPENLRTQRDVYVDGYWQSEQYFIKSEAEIRADFQFRTMPSSANKGLLSLIPNCNAISLHVRRGDYVKNKALHKIHGTCSDNYYINAVNFIADKVSEPVFFIFSDDINWARENLVLNYPAKFIDINDGAHAYEDLRLMSNCKHHILANSSFSWWGAWLNNNPGKITLSPKIWFADTELNKQASSIRPANWITI